MNASEIKQKLCFFKVISRKHLQRPFAGCFETRKIEQFLFPAIILWCEKKNISKKYKNE